MFSVFVSLALVQLCLALIMLVNPRILKLKEKEFSLVRVGIGIVLLLVLTIGGLQEFTDNTGPYGDPSNWAQAVSWAATSLLIAISARK